MPARPISSATVSFGLVSVPVHLFAAGETQSSISFHLLHQKDGVRLKQQYICPADGEKVERSEMAKGYEIPDRKGQYVKFTQEEIKNLEEKKTETIGIEEFVPAAKVDRIYVDRVYYLGPNKGGERAYRLLAEALKETGLAALGQYAARGKQYLVLIRPKDGALVMEQLHYADEVRSIKDVPVGEGPIKDAELKLAVQFIKQSATEEFKPEKYRDTVRDRMLESIQKKIDDGQEITAEPDAEPQAQILDLMEALKASVAKKGKAAEEEAAEPAKKPAKKRKAS